MKPKFVKQTNIDEYLNSIEPRFYPFLAFLLTAFTYGIILSCMGLMGNGLYVLETSDLRIQIIPFIMRFCDVIRGKHDLWYSWDFALGSGAIGTYAYYTLSPFNIFYLILGKNGIHIATYIITVLKASTAALTFQIFITEFNRKAYYETVLFSTMYGLCGYMICYYHAFLNMDAVLVFPLIMLGIVRLFRNKKILLLVLSYTYLIGVQMYMGYVAGISSFLIFVIYYIYERKDMKKEDRSYVIFYYILSVITALGLTAFIWIPAILNILEMSDFENLYKEIKHCNPLLIINNLFIGQYQSLDGFVPYIYCGLLSVISLPLFFLNSRFCKRKRIYYGASLILFSIIMLCPPLNLAMHGFDQPNMVGYRYSFVVSFILLVILSKQFLFMRGKNRLTFVYKKYFLLSSIIVFVLCKFFYSKVWGEKYDSNHIWLLFIDVIFALLFFVLLSKYRDRSIDPLTIKVLFTSLIILELMVNVFITYKRVDAMDTVFEKEFYINAQQNTIKKINYDAKDDSIVRTIYADGYSGNVAIQSDISSLALFSSIVNTRLMNGIKHLGFEYSINSITGNGWTPVTLSLLGIDYIIDGMHVVSDDPSVVIVLEPNEHFFQYFAKNSKTLPIAFTVNNEIIDYKPSESVFDNQDKLLSAMMGEQIDCYSETDMALKSDDATIAQEEDRVTIYNNNYPNEGAIVYYEGLEKSDEVMYADLYNEVKAHDNIAIVPLVSMFEGYLNQTFVPQLYPNQIVEVGHDENGVGHLVMNIDAETESVEYEKGYFVYYHPEVFDKVYNKLKTKGMNIVEFDDGYISGNIECSEKCVMFTTIPFENGWNAYVDGKKTEIKPLVENAFVGVPLDEGKHDVELKYIAPGRYCGKYISIATLLMLISFYIALNAKHHNHK